MTCVPAWCANGEKNSTQTFNLSVIHNASECKHEMRKR
jgi:hypothetical protein